MKKMFCFMSLFLFFVAFLMAQESTPQPGSLPPEYKNMTLPQMKVKLYELHQRITELENRCRPEPPGPPEQGLIAHWAFDDYANPGHDSSGRNNHLVQQGMVLISDSIKKRGTSSAYFPDGAQNCFFANNIVFEQNFNISFWIYKTQENTPGYVTPVTNYGSMNIGGSNFYICVDGAGGHHNGGASYMHLEGADPIGQFPLNHSNTGRRYEYERLIPKNIWHHVAIQKSQNSIAMFVDGRRLAAVAQCTSFNPRRICIGNRGLDGDDIPIYMDDIRIYNRALSESEIQELAR
ncbi:MAG: LamG domain-containing protein [Candidatus Brocadiae bacterium]|nr:LamG domain-containing protein [Candidatus Brocadiia bacterium]